MEHQRATQSVQKEQPKTSPSSLRHQTSLNHVAVYPLLELQRTIGNQAVLNLLRSQNVRVDTTPHTFGEPRFSHNFSRIPLHSMQTAAPQTRLKVNQPGDVYEQEADQVATQVMRVTHPEASVPDDEDETKNSLMRKQSTESSVDAATGSPDLPPVVHSVLSNGGGQPLDSAARDFMEPRFGHDFSQVRVFADAKAAQSAQEMNARAYSVGNDIVFGINQYSPETNTGRHLIAHELTHVIQQTGGSQGSSQGMLLNQSLPTRPIRTSEVAIYRAVQTLGGTWDTPLYRPTVSEDAPLDEKTGLAIETGVEILLEFTPEDPVDATDIGISQTATSRVGGTASPQPGTEGRAIPKGEAGLEEGAQIDQLKHLASPITSSNPYLESTPPEKRPREGFHFRDKGGVLQSQSARAYDSPNLSTELNSSQTFESAALAIEGSQAGTFYGSVRWGWQRDGSGKFTALPLTLVSVGVPTATFKRASELWNASKTSTGAETIDLPTTTLLASKVLPSSQKTSELVVSIEWIDTMLSKLSPGVDKTNKEFEKRSLEAVLAKRSDRPTITFASQSAVAAKLNNKALLARIHTLEAELAGLSSGTAKTNKELALFAVTEEAIGRAIVSKAPDFLKMLGFP